MELSKKDTKMIQGLSVLAMLCLHLFDRNYEGLFTPIFFIFGKPLSFYFGQLSDFCVMGFAFCTSYAHMTLCEDNNFYRKRLKSLLVLLCNYWVIIIIFSIISIIMGEGERMPGSILSFILNASMINITYNGAWWYMYAYTVLVLTSPLMMKMVRKVNPVLLLVIATVIYCVCHYIRFSVTTDNLLLSKIGPFGVTWFEYIIGAVCCKTCYFTKVGKIKQKLDIYILLTIILLLGMLIGHTLIVQSVIVAPVTGLIIITIFQLWHKPSIVKSIFTFVGDHSTNIWLTHMFFYLVLFKDLVYIAKYPILIYLLMLAITIPVSMILTLIEKPIAKKISSI